MRVEASLTETVETSSKCFVYNCLVITVYIVLLDMCTVMMVIVVVVAVRATMMMIIVVYILKSVL